MTIDLNTLGLVGAIMSPFLVMSYYIVRKIHTEALCHSCGNKQWCIEHEIVDDENNKDEDVYNLIFKCVNCGHIRSKHTYKIIKNKDKSN